MFNLRNKICFLIIPLLIFNIIFESIYNIGFTVSAEVVTTAYIDGTNVNVRTEASTKSTIIEKASNRTAKVLGQTTDASGYIWYRITYHNGSQQITGFIRYDNSYIRIVEYDPGADFESKLSAFPESYRTALRELHAAYPNWNFVPDPVNVAFSEQVALQAKNMRKQVQMNGHPVSWRSMEHGSYDWVNNTWITTNGGWTGASKEIIAYYMDPRNFLNDTNIYMFLLQSFNPQLQNEDGVKKILKGTFMESNYADANDTAYGGSYAKVIMKAAETHGVNPYILASKIRQEIGVNESAMVSGKHPGFENLYNFFNIGASGNDNDVLTNGLIRARQEGWTTRSSAIIGGAKFLSNNYVSKGQDTYYLQNFNIHDTNNLWHQYAQAVHDSCSKGASLAGNYRNKPEYSLTFKIPVYNSMPSAASQKPVSSNLKNNYYLSNIQISGLTPSFSMYTREYSLSLSGDTSIKAIAVPGASVVGNATHNIKKGDNYVTITVKAENGNLSYYNINVNATVDCILNIVDANGAPITNSGNSTPHTVVLGDTNFDEKIDIIDLAKVQMHILNLKILSGDSLKAADTNSDNKVDIIDLAKVQMHILGLKYIK